MDTKYSIKKNRTSTYLAVFQIFTIYYFFKKKVKINDCSG